MYPIVIVPFTVTHAMTAAFTAGGFVPATVLACCCTAVYPGTTAAL